MLDILKAYSSRNNDDGLQARDSDRLLYSLEKDIFQNDRVG